MSYCINPHCPQPQNSDISLFCVACGSDLLLQGCYRILRPLGIGGFGKTFEVEDHGTQKILKVLHNTHPKAIELFQQEATVLQQLHHPGIPRVEADGYFIFQPQNSPPLHCLIMEKIEGMNLETWMQTRNHEPIIERAAIRWLKQLIEILHTVHQKQYFHRDIKPPNIILRPDGQLALIDFGTAREVTQTFMQKLEGQQITGIISAGYTPSEQVNGKAVPQSDFFALGRTFVYLLTGKNPTDFHEEYHTGDLIWRNSLNNISPQLADLINDMMQPFPGKRPQNATEILQRLQTIEQSFAASAPPTFQPQTPHTVPVFNTPTSSLPKIPAKLLAGFSIVIIGGAGFYYFYQNTKPAKSPLEVDINISKNIMTSPNNSSLTPTPVVNTPTSEPASNQPTSKSTVNVQPSNLTNNQPTPTLLNSPNSVTCIIEVADPQDPTLNVRSGPGVSYTLLRSLENGTRLSVVQEKNGWYLIDAPIRGWLAANRTRKLCN